MVTCICPNCGKELKCSQEVEDGGSVITQWYCTDSCGYWFND